MSKTIKLNIISPGKETITEEVISVNTKGVDGNVEFQANHAPIIMSTIPTVTRFIKKDGSKVELFTSTGIVYIKNNEIKFACDSYNWASEIDINRATSSMERAKERLKSNEIIDEERARRALARAMARLTFKDTL